MKLYCHPLSGHAHRARLFLNRLAIEHEETFVDLAKGAHKTLEYLKLNALGQIPVLVDGEHVISDSNAILVYLAKKSGDSKWLPDSPAQAAAVQRWLSVAAGQIAFGPAAARLVTVFGGKFNAEEVIARAHAIPQGDRRATRRPRLDREYRRGASDHRGCRALQLHLQRPGRERRSLWLRERECLAAPHRSAARFRAVPEDGRGSRGVR